MSVLANFWRLAAWERRVVCRLAMLQLQAWLRLRLFALPAVAGLYENTGPGQRVQVIAAGLSAVEFANRCYVLAGGLRVLGLVRNGCLERSLALSLFLSRHGLQTRVRIGVLPGTLPLHAHAWVEFDGAPLGGEDVLAFRTIADLRTCTGRSV